MSDSPEGRPAWLLVLVSMLLLSNGVWLWVVHDQAGTFDAWLAEMGARRRAVEALATSLEHELAGRERALVIAHLRLAHPDATLIERDDRVLLGDIVFIFDAQGRLQRVDHDLATAKRD